MKQNVYVGLLDTCESRSEAEAESTQAYADSAITNRYDGIGISTTGKQDITYYIVDIVLTPEMVFKNVKIAGFPLQNHDVDFVIGMDIISKGTLLVKNNSGKTVVTFTV